MARQATPRATRRLRGWIPSVLPEVVTDDPDERRDRRDRIVDAIMYLVAFAIGFATLVDTWELHAPWLRPVAIVFGIAGLVSLHWRRSHPAAVGIFASAVSIVIVTSGANFVALFNAAIRARGRDLTVIAGLTIVSCFTNPSGTVQSAVRPASARTTPVGRGLRYGPARTSQVRADVASSQVGVSG
jgi:hypothetical protein